MINDHFFRLYSDIHLFYELAITLSGSQGCHNRPQLLLGEVGLFLCQSTARLKYRLVRKGVWCQTTRGFPKIHIHFF